MNNPDIPKIESVPTAEIFLPKKDILAERLNEQLSGKTFTFHSDSNSENDRTSEVQIDDVDEVLGKDASAKFVLSVKASVLNEGVKSPSHPFVLKVFGNSDMAPLQKVHSALVAGGFPTWQTYRFTDSKDAKMILMTNGNQEGKTLLTGNENLAHIAKMLFKPENQIQEIANFDSMIAQAEEIILQANEKEIYIPGDAWGFFVDNSAVATRTTEISLIIADLDCVRVGWPLTDEEKKSNYIGFSDAMRSLLNNYVGKNESKKYFELLRNIKVK